ncbi:hypothetical protein FRC10_000337 [Ceratobasidium sp. 414]|nr:hypothetical protein FRC10_000337 [Ceratobasidium sp. 414]
MVRTPSRQVPATPRRSPRLSTRPIEFEIEFIFYERRMCYHPPHRILELTRVQSGGLHFRSLPEGCNPFVSEGVWSFSPRSGITRMSTIGRKIGDIHFSILSGTLDATFYVCLPGNHERSQWVVVERGSRHPLYPDYVLYQRGRSAPRWITIPTFAKYVRRYDGNLSIFNK